MNNISPDVSEPELVALGKDLRALSEGETVVGCDVPLAGAGSAMEAVEPVYGDDAEVAAIVAATLGKVSVHEALASMEEVHLVEQKDDQGRVWFSGQRGTKVPDAW